MPRRIAGPHEGLRKWYTWWVEVSMRTWMAWVVVAVAGGCEEDGVRFIGANTQFDTGLGSGTATVAVGICDEVNTAWLCTAYSGRGWTESQAAADCPSTYVPGGTCPSTTLGYCVSDPGLTTEARLYYYEPGYLVSNVPGLQTDCEAAGGEWR